MANLKHNHEPWIHITKRDDMPRWKMLLVEGCGILVALVVCGVILALITGLNPIDVYTKMYKGTFGNEVKMMPSIHNVAILLCISLAVTPAFKMKFWNIGAEGQVLVGALASAFFMVRFADGSVNNSLLLVMMFVFSVLAGMIWALIPAFFKAVWNTNETLFTLMMNYIAMTLVSVFIVAFDKSGRKDLGIINMFTGVGHMPKVFNDTYILNIIIVVAVLIIMSIYLKYSKQGYEISVVGESENTARYIGINVKKVIIRTMMISGAVCGLVGFMIVAGVQHGIKEDIVGGQGFTAIMVSWMAKFNPIAMVLVSLLIVFLRDGGKAATSALKMDNSIGDVLTALVIFFIIAFEFFIRYKVTFRKIGKKEAKQ